MAAPVCRGPAEPGLRGGGHPGEATAEGIRVERGLASEGVHDPARFHCRTGRRAARRALPPTGMGAAALRLLGSVSTSGLVKITGPNLLALD